MFYGREDSARRMEALHGRCFCQKSKRHGKEVDEYCEARERKGAPAYKLGRSRG